MEIRRLLPTPVRYDATPGGPNNHCRGLGHAARHRPGELEAEGLAKIREMLPTPLRTDSPGRPAGLEKQAKLPATVLAQEDLRRRGMLPTPLRSDSWFGDVDPGTAASSVESGSRAKNQLAAVTIAEAGGGELNPEWVEWLMGYPAGWTESLPSATPSSPRSRRSSAARSSAPSESAPPQEPVFLSPRRRADAPPSASSSPSATTPIAAQTPMTATSPAPAARPPTATSGPTTAGGAPANAAPVTVGLRPRLGLGAPVVLSALCPAMPRAPYSDPFLAHHAARLDAAGDAPLRFDGIDGPSAALGLDVEVFPNFAVACLVRFDDGARAAFELSRRSPEPDLDGLRRLLSINAIYTFNGESYDLPILALLLAGATNEELKDASDRIVRQGLRRWDLEREFGVKVPRCARHVDLKEPCPGVHDSLKIIAGRLHARFVVDLPFDPDVTLTPRQMNVATLYCFNDVDHLRLLREHLMPALELRAAIGRDIGVDVMSRSDAQVGEAIIRSRVERVTGRKVGKRELSSTPPPFRYAPPEWLRFDTPQLRGLLDELRDVTFRVNGAWHVDAPEGLKKRQVTIAGTTYTMGVGGLHSNESTRALVADDEHAIEDIDVSSHYPLIIAGLGLYPPAVGPEFKPIADAMIAERLAAKVRCAEIDREIAALEKELRELEGG